MIMSDELAGLDDYAFANRWRDMPQDEKTRMPLIERSAAIKRFRELTPWIDDSVDRLEASAKRIEAAVSARADITPSKIEQNLIDWSTLIGDPPPFAWLMDQWLSWHPTLLAGRGGIGKSLLIQQVGTVLSVGMPTWAGTAQPVRVLYWACEDDTDQLWRREDLICKSLKIGFDRLTNFHVDARQGLENTLMSSEYGNPMWTPQIERLRQQVNDMNIDVLALDNVSHAFGANENNRHDVTKFINGVSGLVTGRRFCPIFLAHPSKAPGSEYSGSTAWETAVRMRWYLDDKLPDKPSDNGDPPDQNYRFLSKRKTNYTQLDYMQLRFENGVMVWQEQETQDTGLMKVLRGKKARSVILFALPKLYEVGIVCNDYVGRNYLPAQILNNKMGEGCTKAELTDAMREMVMAKELIRDVVGKNNARRPIIGLKLA